jgi:hypothetical protein
MPNILLETLGGDRNQINVAYYYDVPANKQLAGAVNSSREPARGTSTNLDQAGKDGLKNGAVYEYLHTFRRPDGWTSQQVRDQLIADRAALAQIAAAEYDERYKYVGLFYNGTSWGG